MSSSEFTTLYNLHATNCSTSHRPTEPGSVSVCPQAPPSPSHHSAVVGSIFDGRSPPLGTSFRVGRELVSVSGNACSPPKGWVEDSRFTLLPSALRPRFTAERAVARGGLCARAHTGQALPRRRTGHRDRRQVRCRAGRGVVGHRQAPGSPAQPVSFSLKRRAVPFPGFLHFTLLCLHSGFYITPLCMWRVFLSEDWCPLGLCICWPPHAWPSLWNSF